MGRQWLVGDRTNWHLQLSPYSFMIVKLVLTSEFVVALGECCIPCYPPSWFLDDHIRYKKPGSNIGVTLSYKGSFSVT